MCSREPSLSQVYNPQLFFTPKDVATDIDL